MRVALGSLGSLTECQHFVDLLKAVSKPRAGALGSHTECPNLVDLLNGIS
jgi:hypothetical protein